MALPGGTPTDRLDDVLATGRTDVTTCVVSMSARDPDGLDQDYLAWHALDHEPEQHRLAALRGSLRVVSTPACRAARVVSTARYDAVDHVMTYLFAGADQLAPFFALGAALGAGGRMPRRLPSVELGIYHVADTLAAPRTSVGSDVVPWRPAQGVFLIVEQGSAPVHPLVELPGVAGVWSFLGAPSTPPRADTVGLQISYCYLDDDPVAVTEHLRSALADRWADGAVVPLLAAPFHTVAPYAWDRSLP